MSFKEIKIPYGSRVYGTNDEKSDYDYIIITENRTEQVLTPNESINYISKSDFQKQLIKHEISALEGYFWMEQNNIFHPFQFELNKQQLRKSLSAKASNSFVKFKKKISLENEDNYIGLKSLFHSIRIPTFGVDIVEGLVNFQNSFLIKLWSEMKKDAEETNYNLDFLIEKYKPIYNKQMSAFRKVAPKEPQEK